LSQKARATHVFSETRENTENRKKTVPWTTTVFVQDLRGTDMTAMAVCEEAATMVIVTRTGRINFILCFF
jgi:predicted transcriptional regulator